MINNSILWCVRMVEYAYAIVHKGTNIVASRFESKEAAEDALKRLPSSSRRMFKIVSIDDPIVREYYRKVNMIRARNGLKPIDPRRG